VFEKHFSIFDKVLEAYYTILVSPTGWVCVNTDSRQVPDGSQRMTVSGDASKCAILLSFAMSALSFSKHSASFSDNM
jgi:hypothetical protein